MTHDADSGIIGQHAVQPRVHFGAAVRDDHLSGMERVSDSDSAAMMERNPTRSGSGVEERIQDGPIRDRIAAVFHRFRLTERRRDRSAIQMVAPDSERRFESSRANQMIQA